MAAKAAIHGYRPHDEWRRLKKVFQVLLLDLIPTFGDRYRKLVVDGRLRGHDENRVKLGIER